MKRYKRQSGFTLVEIAIVLVIIGLLLGGILKGQQLINSARVRNMADQNSGVQAAYYGFIDRFRQVPGDMLPATACGQVTATLFNCGTTPFTGATIGGDQDGRIDSWAESGAVWAHLSAAGFLNGSFSGNVTAATGAATAYDVGVPAGAVPGNAFQAPIMLANTNDYENNAVAQTVRLAYSFGAGGGANLLRELDVKLDDGVPDTGVVRSTLRTAVAGEVPLGGVDLAAGNAAGSEILLWAAAFGADCLSTAADNTGGATWNVDSDNTRCNAVFLY